MTKTSARKKKNNAAKKASPIMNFLRGIPVWHRKGDHSLYVWCFAVPFLIMLLIYVAMSAYPFGKGSVLVLDLNGQYVYFFEAFRDWVWGEGSLLYSFSRALGGEFVGIYAYYLSSPLSYIVAIFPKSMITEAIFLMLLIKTGLSGLTFGWFLRKNTESTKNAVVMFSCLYALSGYAVIMQHNTMWIDNLFLLPVIAIGIEALIREGKYKLFTLSLALAVFSNFYIGYMTCIFAAIYFFYCFFSRSQEVRNPRGVRFHFLKSISRMALFSAIAVGIASIIILPAYYSLTFGKTEFSDPIFSFASKFDLIDMLSKLFFGSYDTVRPEGLPILYCGTIVLVLIPFFFSSKRIPMRQKVCSAVVLLILVFSFNINALNLFWHGFQNPNWLNYRQSYMFCFMLIYMAAQAYCHIRDVSAKSLLLVGAGLVTLLIFIQHFDYDFLDDLYTIWAGIGIVAFYMLALIAINYRRDIAIDFATSLLAMAVMLEAFGGGLLNVAELSDDVAFSTRASYVNFLSKWQGPVDYVKENDPAFYRMEKTVTRKVNDPMALGYYGLSGSTSTLNTETIAFLQNLGFSSMSHWSRYVGGIPLTNSLLGIKYVLAESDEEMSDYYDLFYKDGDVSVYLNPYALSLAFGVANATGKITFKGYEFDENDVYIEDGLTHIIDKSPFKKLNAMLSAMTGDDRDLFTSLDSRTSMDGLLVAYVAEHRKYYNENSATPGSITYTMTAQKDGAEVYFYIPSLYLREVSMKLNGEDFGTYLTNDTRAVVSLGRYDAGDKITLTLTLKGSEIYLGTGANYFYYLNDEVFTSAMSTLSSSQLEIDEYTQTHFRGTINLAQGSTTVMTTIPYDKGWKIAVDGVAVETYKVLDALLAFDASEGEHTIEMRYMPDEYIIAFRIFAASSLFFAAIVTGEYLYKKKKSALTAAKATEA